MGGIVSNNPTKIVPVELKLISRKIKQFKMVNLKNNY